MGREARINAAARSTSLSPRDARRAKKQQEDDLDYLKFLARNIESTEQFNAAISASKPAMRDAVRAAILPHLPENLRSQLEPSHES